MLSPTLERKLDQCTTLPTLPAVAVKIVQLCQRDDVGAGDIGSVLATDPALSVKVLKLVNSAAFGQRQEVRTLSHAVALMGTNALRALALSFSLVPDATRRKRVAMDAFWKRAVVSAIAARELARVVDRPLAEEAFLCGLLQDLGMLALTQVLGAEYQQLLVRAGDDNEALAALEHRALGTDHAEVGAWLLERWRLPAVMCHAAGLSHRPSRIDAETEPDAATLIRITAAAGLLADIWLRPDVPSATGRVKVRLGGFFRLPEEAIQALLTSIAAAMPEIGPLFDIDLGRPDNIVRVLEAAKETLLVLSLSMASRIDAAQRAMAALEDRAELLEREAQRDTLTGLCNRRSLERYLEKEFSIAFHTRSPLAVILGDVDLLKAVNAAHGHAVGDETLKAIARVLTANMRPPDLAGRYGGEEFLVVLPNTPSVGAEVVAERLRARIEALEVPVERGAPVRVTMSLGYATTDAGSFTSYAELLRAADDALYEAKRDGHNRVVGDGPSAASPPGHDPRPLR